MRIYYAVPAGGPSLLPAFLGTLENKLRQKIQTQFRLLQERPLPREPTVKHFSIARYSHLYELRAKNRVMVRIIFTLTADDDILLLVPFIKSHKRNTMQALEASLKLLAQIQSGTCSVKEMSIKPKEESI